MLVTTHTLIASTVAIKTGNPWIYIPFAAVEHFLLDMLPHFGKGPLLKRRNFQIATLLDAIAGISLFFFLVSKTGFPIYMLFFIDFLAGWPDLVWLLDSDRSSRFAKFHKKIQKFESPAGIVVEIGINLVCLYLIFK